MTTLAELKSKMARYSHRADLDPHYDDFVQGASERIGRRFGVMPSPLVADGDTNSVLTTHPHLYLAACMIELSEFTEDLIATREWMSIWREQASDMNINYQGLDWAACAPPVMCRMEDDGCTTTTEPVATTTPAP